MEIQLLDKVSVELIQQVGSDLTIAQAARVSTKGVDCAKEEWSENSVRMLLRYLMRMRHGSPFEHGLITFHVRAPIFVWREWHRHRVGFSYSEESARYKTLEPVFYVPPVCRPLKKVDWWKPGKPEFSYCTSQEEYNQLIDSLANGFRQSYEAYLKHLDIGCDPGIARAVLPVSIFSSGWVTCNPRSLMHFLSLRTHEEEAKYVSYPLYEIEQAARQCEWIFMNHWPVTYQAFNEFGRVAP